MEAWWISALVGGRASPSILRAPFFVFRVKVCRAALRWYEQGKSIGQTKDMKMYYSETPRVETSSR
jgi:hypothetical protein